MIHLPFSYVLDAAMGYACTRDKAWVTRVRARKWGPTIIQIRWMMIGTFVITTTLQADYFVRGKLAPLAVLGVYYFANPMPYMSAAFITEKVRRAGAVSQPRRRPGRAPSRRAAAICTVLGAPMLMVFAAEMGPLESVVWGGLGQTLCGRSGCTRSACRCS